LLSEGDTFLCSSLESLIGVLGLGGVVVGGEVTGVEGSVPEGIRVSSVFFESLDLFLRGNNISLNDVFLRGEAREGEHNSLLDSGRRIDLSNFRSSSLSLGKFKILTFFFSARKRRWHIFCR